MRTLLLLLLLPAGIALAQRPPADLKDEAVVARYAESVAARALTFTQGDVGSLIDARDDFSGAAWRRFVKKNFEGGLLDDKGAPMYGSSFAPSGKAIDIRPHGKGLRVTVPGVLTHTRSAGGGRHSTAYRAEVEVQIAGTPVKVEQLEHRTCGGASVAKSCRK